MCRTTLVIAGSLPPSPADSGVSDVDSSSSGHASTDELKARLQPPGLGPHSPLGYPTVNQQQFLAPYHYPPGHSQHHRSHLSHQHHYPVRTQREYIFLSLGSIFLANVFSAQISRFFCTLNFNIHNLLKIAPFNSLPRVLSDNAKDNYFLTNVSTAIKSSFQNKRFCIFFKSEFFSLGYKLPHKPFQRWFLKRLYSTVNDYLKYNFNVWQSLLRFNVLQRLISFLRHSYDTHTNKRLLLLSL